MKRLLLLFAWPALAFSAAHGQCCPYIGGITIEPAQPTVSDPVRIITQVTTPNIGSRIYSFATVDGDTILVEACYWEGMLTMPLTITDTLDVGLLPAGDYTVVFTAYNSSSDVDCIVTNQQQATAAFTVDAVSGLAEADPQFHVFPNPVSEALHIESPMPVEWRLLTTDGKLLAAGKETTIDFSARAAGIYLLEMNGEVRKVWKQ